MPWPGIASSHLVCQHPHQHHAARLGSTPGQMHNKNLAPCVLGVLRCCRQDEKDEVCVWLGSTPRQDAHEKSHTRGGGVLIGLLLAPCHRLATTTHSAWSALLGSTPRPDAQTSNQDMHGWGVRPGPTCAEHGTWAWPRSTPRPRSTPKPRSTPRPGSSLLAPFASAPVGSSGCCGLRVGSRPGGREG